MKNGDLARLADPLLALSQALERHPKVGASWEGFIIENLIQMIGVDARQCYFWATHAGAEIDLLVQTGGTKLRGFEVKYTTAPQITRSSGMTPSSSP